MDYLILLHIVLALGYTLLGGLAWRDLPQLSSIAQAANRTIYALKGLTVLLLIIHGTLLYVAIITVQGINLNFANALSTVAWLAVLLYSLGSWLRWLPGTAVMIMPVAALCSLLPLIFTQARWLLHLDKPWAEIHILVAFAAYSLFILAALQALLLMMLERRLHSAQLELFGSSSPPLLSLERFLFRLIAAAFALLTVTLFSGMLFSEAVFSQPFKVTHKTFFGLLSWLIFAGLLFGRYRYGWRGRTALRWILTGSALLLLAYAGSKFVLEIILRR